MSEAHLPEHPDGPMPPHVEALDLPEWIQLRTEDVAPFLARAAERIRPFRAPPGCTGCGGCRTCLVRL